MKPLIPIYRIGLSSHKLYDPSRAEALSEYPKVEELTPSQKKQMAVDACLEDINHEQRLLEAKTNSKIKEIELASRYAKEEMTAKHELAQTLYQHELEAVRRKNEINMETQKSLWEMEIFHAESRYKVKEFELATKQLERSIVEEEAMILDIRQRSKSSGGSNG